MSPHESHAAWARRIADEVGHDDALCIPNDAEVLRQGLTARHMLYRPRLSGAALDAWARRYLREYWAQS